MISRSSALFLIALLGAGLSGGCEKEARRAAERAYVELTELRLPPEEEARALEAFVERYPDPKTNRHLTRACMVVAAYHARSGRNEKATSWYERALSVRSDDPDLMNALGYHYARQGAELDRAITLLESAVRLAEERDYPAPRVGRIKDSLGWAYRMRGDPELAIPHLEEACRLAPEEPILRQHLADAYLDAGDTIRGAEIYLQLHAESGGDERLCAVLERIGRTARESGLRELARRIADALGSSGGAAPPSEPPPP